MQHIYSGYRMRLTFVMLSIFSCINSYTQTLTARPNTSMTSTSNGFYEYLPSGYSPTATQTYPVLLAFGGISQNGNGTSAELDNVLSNWGGPGWQIKNGKFPSSITVNGTLFRFIVILPQFSSAASPQNIDSVISYVISHYRADSTRIYMTGNSLGGGYCWDYPGASIQYGKRVAAIVPTCAAAYYFSYKVNNIAAANLPVWATHNAYDVTVDPIITTNFVNGINASPTPPNPLAKKTFFQDASHNCADSTFNMTYGIGAYAWMLQYRRAAANKPPVAKAGSDVTITLPKDSVLLNGNSSYDPEGGIMTYSWSKIAGPTQFTISNSAIVNPLIKNLIAGTYTLRLTVTDNKGATSMDDINIIVNQRPIANAGPDVVITLPKDSVLLDGSASYDPEGGPLTYSWAKTSGPTQYTLSSASVVKPVVKNLVAGSYTFRLTVTDNKGAKTADNINIFVNKPPVANAGPDSTIVLPTNSVQLNGNGSSDPEGGALTYSWSKIAGPTQYTISNSAIVNPLFSNLIAGAYTLRLTVTDIKKAKASDDINIIVKPVGGQSFVANSGLDELRTIPVRSVTSVKVFPNPITSNVVLQVTNSLSGVMKVQIIDANGAITRNILLTHTSPISNVHIPLKNLRPGAYIIRVQIGNSTASDKVIKL